MSKFTVYRYARPLEVYIKSDAAIVSDHKLHIVKESIKTGVNSQYGITFRFDADPVNKTLTFTHSICDGVNFDKSIGRDEVDRAYNSGMGVTIDYQLDMPLMINVIQFLTKNIPTQFKNMDNGQEMMHLMKCFERIVKSHSFPKIKIIK